MTATQTNTNKIETIIDKRTGDKPSDTPGEVIPGADLRRRLGLATPKPKEDDKPEPEVAAEKAEPAKNEKRGRKAKVSAPAPSLDLEALTTAVAAGVKAAQTPEKVEKVENAVEDPAAALGPKQKRVYSVLQRMEVSNPENKGKAAAYLDAQHKFSKYKSAWESEHPGKSFDVDSDEHEEFLTKNDVTYDGDEFTEALADLKAEERANAVVKPLQEKLTLKEEQERQTARAIELAPRITSHQKITAKVFFNQLGDDFKGVLDDTGTVVQDELKKIADSKPISGQVFRLAEDTERFAGEVMRIASGVAKFSETNPLHVRIFQFAAKQEQEMMALPEDQRVNDEGKQFVTAEKFSKLTPAKQKNYWTYNDADLSTLYAIEMADAAAKAIKDDEEQFNKRIEKMGISRPAVAEVKPAVVAKPAAVVIEPESKSPAGVVAPRMAQAGHQSKNSNSSTKTLLQRITS